MLVLVGRAEGGLFSIIFAALLVALQLMMVLHNHFHGANDVAVEHL